MLSPQRKVIKDQFVSSAPCVGKLLCIRRPTLWALLIILIICIAVQIFVAHQTGGLAGLKHKQQVFQDISESVSLQTPGPEEPDPLQRNRTVDSSGGVRVDKTVRPDSDTQIEDITPERLLQVSDTENPLNLRPSQTTRTSPPTDPQTFDPSSSLQTETTCSPKTHLVFLKTHKTASSTILNILYRYGESRGLTFALPMKRHMQLFYPHFFAEHFVEGVKGQDVKEFHIMCNHMRFAKSEVAKVMPEQTFYFSILRHPLAMMESIYSYYKSITVFRKTISLDNFLDQSLKNQMSPVSRNHYAHNVLAFDFGLENNVTADSDDLEERVSAAIAAIERDFQLILISEYFDESMILLRHALCWTLEDVVYFKLNSRSDGSRQPLLHSTAEKIQRWNALDWRIYLHFNATFWQRVGRLIGGEQMKRELNALRELQAKLANICLKDGRAVHPSKVKDTKMKPYQSGKAVIQGYNLNPLKDPQTRNKCVRLITPELQYTKLLYNKQFPGFHD